MQSRALDPFEFVLAVLLVSLLSVMACAALGATSRSAHAELLRLGLNGLFAQASRHAVASGVSVVLCPVKGLPYRCSGGSDWSRGWIGFTDLNGNGQFDWEDRLLRRDLALPDGLRLCALAGRKLIRFEPRAGKIVSGGGFVLCDVRCPSEAVALRLSNQGSLRTEAASVAAAQQCLLK
ncbi:GspH/FimT family protein [Pseudomonas sp. CGJS7]|uniref:GspH/FimT family protein n=1 Tax=Pseudomonas sp. CGJS7 TaxID=3109348 RepID=UPI00300B39E7